MVGVHFSDLLDMIVFHEEQPRHMGGRKRQQVCARKQTKQQ